MIGLFLRTFVSVLVLDLGSPNQMLVAAISSNTRLKALVWIASSLALILSSYIGLLLGNFIERLRLPTNIISGFLMLIIGIFLLVKK